MNARYARSRSIARTAMTTLVCLMLVTTTACSVSSLPRNHWWQFWRTKQADGSNVHYPDNQTLPPTPDTLEPGKTPGGAELPYGAIPPPPGDMTEPGAKRQGATSATELKTVYFAYDSAELDEKAVATLDNDAAWLIAHPGYQIQLEGHCDDRGTVEYNLNLGDRRAKSAKAYLVSKGVSADSLHTISYGEERPIEPGADEAALAMNRRVQFLVY